MSNANDKERTLDTADTVQDDELGMDDLDKVAGGFASLGPDAAAGKGRAAGPEAATDKGFFAEGPEKSA